MRRQRSTAVVMGDMFRPVFDLLRGGAYASGVRLAPTRAFRELVHDVTREGTQATVSGQ